MWIFGYGSLIWKVGFEVEEQRPGFVEGWARRFWQDSTDHRGVPDAPGRVVTLVPDPAATTFGVAYRIPTQAITDVLEQLDEREKGGYERHIVTVRAVDGAVITDDATIYIGGRDNPNWGGPLEIDEIARIVASAHGPSGPNLEYVLELHRALQRMDADDEHISALVEALACDPLADT